MVYLSTVKVLTLKLTYSFEAIVKNKFGIGWNLAKP
jgi:hypothetical protein